MEEEEPALPPAGDEPGCPAAALLLLLLLLWSTLLPRRLFTPLCPALLLLLLLLPLSAEATAAPLAGAEGDDEAALLLLAALALLPWTSLFSTSSSSSACRRASTSSATRWPACRARGRSRMTDSSESARRGGIKGETCKRKKQKSTVSSFRVSNQGAGAAIVSYLAAHKRHAMQRNAPLIPPVMRVRSVTSSRSQKASNFSDVTPMRPPTASAPVASSDPSCCWSSDINISAAECTVDEDDKDDEEEPVGLAAG